MHLASLQARDKVTSQTLTAHEERMSAIQALTWSHEQAIQDVGIAAKKVKQDLLELGGDRLATSHVLDRADGNLRDLVEELKQPHTSLDGKEARIKSPETHAATVDTELSSFDDKLGAMSAQVQTQEDMIKAQGDHVASLASINDELRRYIDSMTVKCPTVSRINTEKAWGNRLETVSSDIDR